MTCVLQWNHGVTMRISTLKPRISAMQTSRVRLVTDRIGATPRTRGRAWMEARAKWLRQHPLCVACLATGRTTAAEEVDHIIPLWCGGRDDDSNFQSLCKPCHAVKTAEEAKGRGG